MEVTTMSPPPPSPTEGVDLCETDGTNMAIHSVTLLICLCGLAGNGAFIGLINMEHKDSDISVLAVTDFLFLLLTLPAAFLFLVEDVSCSPVVPVPYLRFLFQLSLVSFYFIMFFLVLDSSSVLYVLLKLCCYDCKIPKLLMWLMVCVLFWAFFALFTVLPTVTFLCPSHQQQHCRAALISVFTLILLFFAAPLVISSIINFIKAKSGSQQQQPKRRNIVIDLILLLTLLLILCNFLQQLGYILVSSEFFFLLTCINSSFKPFIYFLAGRCWRPCSMGSLRLSLQRVFEKPEDNTARSNDPAMDTMI